MEKPAAKHRLSPAAAGWIVGVLCLVVPILLFWPAPKEPPAPPVAPVKRPPSELEKAGLPNDPDLEGLPGFFRVWADYAEWKDDKTTFAYRHPVSGEFSFFFEATRTPEGYWFRPVARPSGWDPDFLAPAAEGSPIGFHRRIPTDAGRPGLARPAAPRIERAPNAVELEMERPATEPPPTAPKR
ncbi:MAG TPA: hypothetical protein VEB66_18450 [Opitutaceae bacterium]|nr:hypothetical protein [Opitutaceae bacterium]